MLVRFNMAECGARSRLNGELNLEWIGAGVVIGPPTGVRTEPIERINPAVAMLRLQGRPPQPGTGLTEEEFSDPCSLVK